MAKLRKLIIKLGMNKTKKESLNLARKYFKDLFDKVFFIYKTAKYSNSCDIIYYFQDIGLEKEKLEKIKADKFMQYLCKKLEKLHL